MCVQEPDCGAAALDLLLPDTSSVNVPCMHHKCRPSEPPMSDDTMSGVTILGLREFLAERLGQDALDSVLRQNGMASDLVAQFMSPQLTYSASLAEDVALG